MNTGEYLARSKYDMTANDLYTLVVDIYKFYTSKKIGDTHLLFKNIPTTFQYYTHNLKILVSK